MLKFRLDKSFAARIVTADGTAHEILGAYRPPIEFREKIERLRLLSCPFITSEFILGADFWQVFEVAVSFTDGVWECEVATLETRPLKTEGNVVSIDALSPCQRKQADDLIRSFESLVNNDRLGRTTLFEQVIDTDTVEPTVQRYYPVTPAMQERMSAELDRMIRLDVVEPSRSPWRSPVVLVKKSNGKDRLCIDSRKVNSVTKFDSYPLPYISSILDRLGRTNFLSSIDLKDAFWQIPLSESSKEKTAFVIPGRGLWQMKVMPFGMRNSAQAMQRLIDLLFSSQDGIFTYLDDIIVVTETFDEHMSLLQLVHERLSEASLTINVEKSHFLRSSLRYLGFVIDGKGLRTDPEKVKAIMEYPRPTTSTEIKRFVGLASWYRRFIRNFAIIAAPIHDIHAGIKKGKPIKWNDAAEAAFNELKCQLPKSPILATPDFTKMFSIHCDASNVGIGAVICQDPEEIPIAFASRKLLKAEVKYTTTEKECLAVIFAIEKFRGYIESTKFKVYTDHSALTWLFRQTNLPDRLGRWVLKFAQYDFEVIHRKGTMNVVPDALSRAFPTEATTEPDLRPSQEPTELNPVCVLECLPCESDDLYNDMIKRVNDNPTDFAMWHVKDGRLFLKPTPVGCIPSPHTYRKVVPESRRTAVLQESHYHPTASHFGIRKTINRVKERYFWPGLARDVTSYVRSCEICTMSKPSHEPKHGLMGKFRYASVPFQTISMDLVGPLPRTTKQNTTIFVVTDWLTKYVSQFAIRQATATRIVHLLENEIFLTYGTPETVIMDNGKQFVSKEMNALLKRYSVKNVWFNSYYHPQNNFTERYNQTVGNCLRAYITDDQRHWDENLYKIQLAMRTATNEVTGYSPFYLNFGRAYAYAGNDYNELEVIPLNRECKNTLAEVERTFNLVKSKMEESHRRNKERYDKDRVDIRFDVGEKVYRKSFAHSDRAQFVSTKLLPRKVPCIIQRKTSSVTYDLVDENGKFMGNYHVKDIFKP